MPKDHTKLDSNDFSALAAFRYALRRFLRFSKEFLAANADLTVEQYEALLALRAFDTAAGIPVGQLSERLQVRHHTTVALTNKLMANGLVTKRRGPDDRRQVYVRLTPEGMKLIEQLAVVHHREILNRSPEMMKALNQLRDGSSSGDGARVQGDA